EETRMRATGGHGLGMDGAERRPTPWGAGWVAGTAALALSGAAPGQETFKLGVVSFLSGQAAESFGIPAVNGAKVVIEALNAGTAPAPYNKGGFGGMKIEPIYVDENGGATKQVQELKNLYDREKVDAVVGYVSSGDCLPARAGAAGRK